MERQLVLTRRSLLVLASAGLAWASGDFWDKEDPADWKPEEVEKLLSKSPWAKQVTATGAPDQSGYGSGSPNGGGYPGGGYPGGGYPGGGYPGGGYPGGGYPGGMGYPRGGGMGYPRRGGYPGGRRPQTRQGTVVWESAQPILDARKTNLPAAFAKHYVIGVSGFPLPSSGDDNADRRLDELKLSTTLQPKGKDIAEPGVVQQNGSSSSWLFGFSKEALTLSPADKEVDFTTRIGSFAVKAKFNLKEMMYHGQLAV